MPRQAKAWKFMRPLSQNEEPFRTKNFFYVKVFRYCNTSWKYKLRRIDSFLVWFLVTSRATQEYFSEASQMDWREQFPVFQSGLPEGLGERRYYMGKGGGGEKVSILQLSHFFASILIAWYSGLFSNVNGKYLQVLIVIKILFLVIFWARFFSSKVRTYWPPGMFTKKMK